MSQDARNDDARNEGAYADYPLPRALALTIIQQIAMHLLAACNGDISAARKAAAQTLAWYNPSNVPELYLSAKIITFNLQAGEALASAADPTVPLNKQMRLRSGAARMDREAGKAERQLARLREPLRPDAAKAAKATNAPQAPQATRPAQPQPQPHPQPHPQPQARPQPQPQPQPQPHPQAQPQRTPATASARQASAPFEDPATMAAYAKSHGITWNEGMSRESREQALSALQAKESQRFLEAVQAALGSA